VPTASLRLPVRRSVAEPTSMPRLARVGISSTLPWQAETATSEASMGRDVSGPQEARMRASDVMTLGAASIHATAPIEEAARLMLRHRISGLPVVDENGTLVGMVTERDLLRGRKSGADRDRPQWLEFLLG